MQGALPSRRVEQFTGVPAPCLQGCVLRVNTSYSCYNVSRLQSIQDPFKGVTVDGAVYINAAGGQSSDTDLSSDIVSDYGCVPFIRACATRTYWFSETKPTLVGSLSCRPVYDATKGKHAFSHLWLCWQRGPKGRSSAGCPLTAGLRATRK